MEFANITFNIFSKNLKFLRKSNRLSQEDLGKVLNIKGQSVSNWEHGKNSPDLQKLLYLSQKFQISLDDLVYKDLEKEGISPPNQNFNDNSSSEPIKSSVKTSYERKLEQMIVKYCPDLADRLDLS